MNIPFPTGLTGPQRRNTLREATTPIAWLSYLGQISKLKGLPKGDGRPVVLVPGYKTGHFSMTPLAVFLNRLGYDTRHWGMGINQGRVEADAEAFGLRIAEHAAAMGEPVTLIGWSLGGVIAREVARQQPGSVREVITLGTPIIGGPKYTVAGKPFAAENGLKLDEFEKYVHEVNCLGLTQPITSIYSKTDGIVNWRASIDIYNEQARNIEVKSPHFGLGVNPDIWRIIAETLGAEA